MLKTHPYIMLIEYAMKERHFSIEQACTACKLSISDFMFIRRNLFALNGIQDQPYVQPNELMEWKLSSEALFGYIQYTAYQDSLKIAAKADRRAVIALIIASISAATALITPLVSSL